MNNWKKNFLLVLISSFLSIFIFYFLFFIKIYFEGHFEHPNLIKSYEKLQFYKNYSKKIHHLRDLDGRWEEENRPENYLFSIINPFANGKRNVLLQGDSWAEQFNLSDESNALIKRFGRKNNFGFINAGTTSFSPSLMQLQYEILEKEFNIKPNIIVVYIDQTDIGDELCRYKDKRIYDKDQNLIAVRNEAYTRASYDYTKLFNISEIAILNQSKFKKNYKLTNFFINYAFFRSVERFKSAKKFGWKLKDISKCRFTQIRKYLIKSSGSEISYFEDRVNDFINLLLSKEYIEKIFFVTFPHTDHIFGYNTLENKKKYYTINVSDIIDKILKNNKRIYHLNFSQLISDGKIHLDQDFFKDNDPGSHLKNKFHAKIFVQNILNLLE